MKTTYCLIACLLLAASFASADVTSLYGTINCFGLPGVSSCPDGSNFETGLGGSFSGDYRDAYDLANAPLTDIWSIPGSISWTQPSYSTAGALSASLSLRIAGIADDGGPYTVLFDGTSIGAIPVNSAPNAFQEVLTYTFTVPVGLLDGHDTVAINGTGPDGYIMDYSDLTVKTAAAVPEPMSVYLLLGIIALVGIVGKRKLLTAPRES